MIRNPLVPGLAAALVLSAYGPDALAQTDRERGGARKSGNLVRICRAKSEEKYKRRSLSRKVWAHIIDAYVRRGEKL